jgi:hypothetical protein
MDRSGGEELGLVVVLLVGEGGGLEWWWYADGSTRFATLNPLLTQFHLRVDLWDLRSNTLWALMEIDPPPGITNCDRSEQDTGSRTK